MNGQDVKCMGFKDMNPMQIEAMTRVMAHALNLADAYGEDAFEEVFQDIDEMVQLFGAHGLTVEVNPKFDY
jgi:S-adenosylmethionine synthetase